LILSSRCASITTRNDLDYRLGPVSAYVIVQTRVNELHRSAGRIGEGRTAVILNPIHLAPCRIQQDDLICTIAKVEMIVHIVYEDTAVSCWVSVTPQNQVATWRNDQRAAVINLMLIRVRILNGPAIDVYRLTTGVEKLQPLTVTVGDGCWILHDLVDNDRPGGN